MRITKENIVKVCQITDCARKSLTDYQQHVTASEHRQRNGQGKLDMREVYVK